MWRRLARHGRGAAYAVVTLVDRVLHRRVALLPPAHLRLYYYRTWSVQAFVRACEQARAELVSRGLRPEHRVLDIGSGIGNLALGLTAYLRGGYDGIEIHPEAVAWCQRTITSRHPDFRFHRADLTSSAYNPRGRSGASQYRFPFDDRSFDFVFLGSVFTHVEPDVVEHYLHEIARVLVPHGVCVASYFLLNDDTRPSVEAGRSFISFDVAHASGLCRLHDAHTPEAAVACDEAFVMRVHDEVGLRIQSIRRGSWWNGVAHDQDVVTAVRSEEMDPRAV